MKYFKRKIRKFSKILLSKALPDSYRLRYLAALPQLNSWQKYRCNSVPQFDNRQKMYEYLNSSILNNCMIYYLEFGVYKGESIKQWLDLNSNPESRFIGFDTFTGLPEDWETFRGGIEKDAFNVNGSVPEISDMRASFIPGLFQDTLNDFLSTFQNSGSMVVHADSDLYSSTLYVLTKFDPILKTGVIIIFDEFASVMDEFRALNDYCSAYNRDYEVLATTKDYYGHVAIRML